MSLLWESLRSQPLRMLTGLMLIGVNRAAFLVLPGSLGLMVDRVLVKHQSSAMPSILAAVAGATALQTLTGLMLDLLLGYSCQNAIASMRTRVQAHIMDLPTSFFDHQLSGVLAARVMKDSEKLRDFIGPVALESVAAIVTGGLAFGGMIFLSVKLTLPLVVLLAVLAGVMRWAAGDVRARYAEIAHLQSIMAGRLSESIAGVRVVKAYAAEPREAIVFASQSQVLEDATVQVQMHQARSTAGASLAFSLIGLLLLYAGTLQVLAGALTVGRLVTYCAFLACATQAARQVGGLRMQFASSLASLDRIASILRESPEDAGKRHPEVPPVTGVVRVHGVSFAYTPAQTVLHDISFTATPGTLTALVGSSGSGKSTLCALLCAFYRPTSGSVLIDDVNLASRSLGDFRDQLGVVFQDPFLFSGSIRENVLIARPSATEAELMECYELVRLDRFVDRLPDRYETLVGERGVRLSGGERQRICMARALLRDPRLLLLDEPTSSLDEESEHYFRETLGHLIPRRTAIVIAHRLSTIRRADQILVLDSGRIVERGDHLTLMALRGHYFRLFQSQPGAHDPAV